MNIQVTIKSNSKAAKLIEKYMAEKAAFKKAISEGNSVKPANQSKTFDTPVQRNN